jgi:hypothetical protein
MTKLVTVGAQLRCSQGAAPASLAIPASVGTDADHQPVATVQHTAAMTNIPAFGMCRSMANPQVASASAAAQGVLTPQPCVPNVTAPWSPGSGGVTINGEKALTSDSTCNCAWAGTIEIVAPGSEVAAE